MLFYSNTDDHSRGNLGFSILPKAKEIQGVVGSHYPLYLLMVDGELM